MIDEVMSAHAGMTLESLHFIAEQQGFEGNGPVVSETAISALSQADRRGRLSREFRDSAVADELMESHLADDRHSLNQDGSDVATHFQEGPVLLEVRRRGYSVGDLAMWARIDSWSAVVAAAAPATAAPFDQGLRQVGLLSIDRVVSALASWIGVVPYWSFSDGPVTLPAAQYEARLADSSEPVRAEAGPHFRRAWNEPWTEYAIHTQQRSLRCISAGESGFWSVVIEGDTATIDALPSRLLFRTLYTQFVDAIDERRGIAHSVTNS